MGFDEKLVDPVGGIDGKYLALVEGDGFEGDGGGELVFDEVHEFEDAHRE